MTAVPFENLNFLNPKQVAALLMIFHNGFLHLCFQSVTRGHWTVVQEMVFYEINELSTWV